KGCCKPLYAIQLTEEWVHGQRPRRKSRRCSLEQVAEHRRSAIELSVGGQALALNQLRFDRPRPAERTKDGGELCSGPVRAVDKSSGSKGHRKPKMRLRVVRVHVQRPFERRYSIRRLADAQQTDSASVKRAHLVLATVQAIHVGELHLTIEFGECLVVIP